MRNERLRMALVLWVSVALIGPFLFVPWVEEPPSEAVDRVPSFDLTGLAGSDAEEGWTLRAIGCREVYYGDDINTSRYSCPRGLLPKRRFRRHIPCLRKKG